MEHITIENNGRTTCIGDSHTLGVMISAAIAQIAFYKGVNIIDYLKDISSTTVAMYKELEKK